MEYSVRSMEEDNVHPVPNIATRGVKLDSFAVLTFSTLSPGSFKIKVLKANYPRFSIDLLNCSSFSTR